MDKKKKKIICNSIINIKYRSLYCLLLMCNNHYDLEIIVDTSTDQCVESIDQQFHYVLGQQYALNHQHIQHTTIDHYDYRHSM